MSEAHREAIRRGQQRRRVMERERIERQSPPVPNNRIDVCVQLRCSMDELSALPERQRVAFLLGVGQIVAAHSLAKALR